MATALAKSPKALTKTESHRLAELEGVISQNLQTSVAALKEIRDSRLYRNEYSTFEEYCKARWRWNKRYSNRLIEAGDIVKSLGSMGPIPERQARELGRIKDLEVRAQVWEQVNNIHRPDEVTAKKIHDFHDEHFGEKAVQARKERERAREEERKATRARNKAATPPIPQPIPHTDKRTPQQRAEDMSKAMMYARLAISQLEEIRYDDIHREEALKNVIAWAEEQLQTGRNHD